MAGAMTRAHARRRHLGPQRRQDVEHRRRAGRLRHVPGPHRLGGAEAPRALDDRGAAAGTPGSPSSPSCRSRAGEAHFCQEFFDDVAAARREPDRRAATRGGRSPRRCSSTSATPPPASATGSAWAAATAAVVARRRPRCGRPRAPGRTRRDAPRRRDPSTHRRGLRRQPCGQPRQRARHGGHAHGPVQGRLGFVAEARPRPRHAAPGRDRPHRRRPRRRHHCRRRCRRRCRCRR